MNKKYFSLVKNEETKEADINIYGDITSYAGSFFSNEADVSAYNLSKQLEELQDVNTINVHISSYGGEVKEGLAIYNALKNSKAKIRTYCDGFACSIASVIFMAGEERIMSSASLLMIHNAWIYAQGNSSELRKQADDLDKITQASINAYMEHVNISEDELKALLDSETWLTYDECLEMGFATSAVNDEDESVATQSVKKSLMKIIKEHFKEESNETTETESDDETDDNKENDTSNDKDNETNNETDENNDDNVDVSSTDDEANEPKKNNDEEDATQRMVAFFSAMIGGMKE